MSAAAPAAPAAGTGRARAVDLTWFRRRQLRTLMGVVAVVVAFQLCSMVCNFSLTYALGSVPAAFVWMLQNFVPTAESLANFPLVITQTVSTALDSVAATVIAAVAGIVLSVLGSSTIGVSWAPVRGAIRAIASVFRNIPMIAWALLLLLSFKQNEFTGFLALFLTTFGQLTRFFLDTFDEIPTGPVEALKSCGAGYWQIVFQQVAARGRRPHELDALHGGDQHPLCHAHRPAYGHGHRFCVQPVLHVVPLRHRRPRHHRHHRVRARDRGGFQCGEEVDDLMVSVSLSERTAATLERDFAGRIRLTARAGRNMSVQLTLIVLVCSRL